MCNTITMKFTNTEQEARSNDVQWLMNLVKKNTGKAFCVPKGTKLREGVAAFTKFSKAHPEIHDPLTDKQAIQALAESFPLEHRRGNPSGDINCPAYHIAQTAISRY